MTLLHISSLVLFVGYLFELDNKLKISSTGKYSVAPGVRRVESSATSPSTLYTDATLTWISGITCRNRSKGWNIDSRNAVASEREDPGEKAEHNAEGTEVGQSSYLQPVTEDMAERGPSRKEKNGDSKNVVQVDPPTSADR